MVKCQAAKDLLACEAEAATCCQIPARYCLTCISAGQMSCQRTMRSWSRPPAQPSRSLETRSWPCQQRSRHKTRLR